MKRKLLTISALALVCGASVACSTTTVLPAPTTNNSVSQEANNAQTNINNTNVTAKITEDKAKEIALNHANLSQNDVTFIRSGLDYDDAVLSYDVELYHNNQEYDYKIDANTGDILEYDLDVENYAIPQVNNNVNANTNVAITDVKAKEIALKHANISQNQVSHINCHLDYDDGIQVYEVSFYVNDTEYSYEINAQNGNIVSYERDSIYD